MESSLSLYQRIMRTLEAELATRGETPGERFATEKELAERFNVSRMTVRRAVQELANKGLLYSIQGKGTFVRGPQKWEERLSPLAGLFDDRVVGENEYERLVPIFEWAKQPSELEPRLHVREDGNVFHMKRLKVANRVRLSVDHRYFASDVGEMIAGSRALFEKYPIRGAFRELGIEASGADMSLESTGAEVNEVDELSVVYGAPVLIRRITFYGADRRPLVIGWSAARGDMYRYSLYVPFAEME